MLESDSLEVIQTCRGEIKKGQIMHIVKDILTIRSRFQSCGFTWTNREANGAAHLIAQHATRGSLTKMDS